MAYGLGGADQAHGGADDDRALAESGQHGEEQVAVADRGAADQLPAPVTTWSSVTLSVWAPWR
ncbi:hypothetical protein SAV31267_011670 [Streptomyces avermitilis]|uniref:Uncharacterized protein n=1 Tax=Streptomyces avermitilis TaxID=33903 RepID=A0A4D4MHZ3_STRAX|nr:hypothetical protein SAV31267_011670 [Streptomyces avermitilis]